MSYHGGEYIPGSYDKNDSQAFADIVSVEELSSLITPELARLETLRSDFRNSYLDLANYADSIKFRSSVDNINRFPEVGDKNVQKFHKYVTYLMKSDDDSDPSIATNLAATSIAEIANTLKSRTFDDCEYLSPSVEDIMEALVDNRGYNEHDKGRIARSASGVYAEFLSYNMSTYVSYIVETQGVRGSRRGGDYLSNIQKNLSRLGMGLVDGYLFKRYLKKNDPGTENE